jgi:hypothetical protein
MSLRHQAAVCLAGLAWAWSSLSAVALAQSAAEPLAVQAATFGIGNKAKAGFWTPIWFDLKAGPNGARGRLEIVIPDGDNIPVIYDEPEGPDLDLAAGQDHRILRYAKLGPLAAPIRVQLRSASLEQGGRVVWSQQVAGPSTRLTATQELIVGIGPDLDLPAALAGIKRTADASLASVQIDAAAKLPDRWWGYEGVDCVVLTTSDAAVLDGFSSDHRDALFTWLRLGGRLVLCTGGRGRELFADDSPWRPLAPGKFVEVSPLRERSGLETFAGAELPWEDESFQRNRPLVTRLAEFAGVVLLDEVGSGNARPLVVRAPHGLGEVVFVGLDLDQPALAEWSGRPRLLAGILAGSQGRAASEERESRRSVTHLGYDDLTGQLRAALDQFPGVALVNFTTVSVLTVVYLLLIGPGDYLLLSRLGIPRQVTWITFTLVALSFGLAAWYLGREAHGSRVRVNQLEIVDIDATDRAVRGTVWTHLYSPQAARFDLVPTARLGQPPLATGRQAWLAWQGLPGNSLGGLASNQRSLVEADAYRILPPGEQSGIQQLAIQSASSKSLSTRWWGEAAIPLPANLVRTEHGPVEGELTNPLPQELSDCLLVYGDWLYRLGTIQAGQRAKVDPRESLNLEYRLTERTVQNSKDMSTPWDQAATDIPRIVRMMMFHEAARGRHYTGLTHRYQPYIDLTEQVRLGRAILVGRCAESFTELTSGDGNLSDNHSVADSADQQNYTWFRIVYPVSPHRPAIAAAE